MLPLLLRVLYAETSATFANVADPFVDRVYGHNFDPENPADAALVSEIASFDEAGIDDGVLTPIHLIAFRREPVRCRYPRRRSPERMCAPGRRAHAGHVRPSPRLSPLLPIPARRTVGTPITACGPSKPSSWRWPWPIPAIGVAALEAAS